MRLNLSPLFSRRLVLGYDIWCQYGVHLLERFRRNPHLSWPEYLEELTGVVGAWHIFAHVRECFGRFSGMYVWGIGIIEMEILETLWSLINMMTEATRSMSRANREETINFYINDMNLKKNQNLSESIDQYRAALPGDRGESSGPSGCPGRTPGRRGADRATVPSTIRKWKKQVTVRTSRQALLETMDASCALRSRIAWQAQLTEVYRKRSVDLEHPELYDPKFMDEFLQSAFKGIQGSLRHLENSY